MNHCLLRRLTAWDRPSIPLARDIFKLTDHRPFHADGSILDTTGRRWAQYSYQFAHEFCHLISGYDRLKDSANSWFHESLCEAASLFALRSMGKTWRLRPPYPNWSSFAEHLTAYAQQLGNTVEPRTPADGALRAWLRGHEAEARTDPYKREANRIIALRMLPVFEHDPTGWNAVRNLPASDAPIEQYLAQWKVAAHACDRAFVARIEVALGTHNPENPD